RSTFAHALQRGMEFRSATRTAGQCVDGNQLCRIEGNPPTAFGRWQFAATWPSRKIENLLCLHKPCEYWFSQRSQWPVFPIHFAVQQSLVRDGDWQSAI